MNEGRSEKLSLRLLKKIQVDFLDRTGSIYFIYILKVLLRECKRHTAHRVASPWGYLPWRWVPTLVGGTYLGWGYLSSPEGYLPWPGGGYLAWPRG